MKKLLVILMMALATAGYSQKLKVIEGDLATLKGQTAMKLEFTYDNLTIGRKNRPEAEYVAEKKADHNKKEAGKGDEWEMKWKENRPNVFEPKFRELFAKESKMTTSDDNATYTLIFKTTNLEPGYKIGLSTVPAYIDGEAWIVETANKDKIIAKVTVQNSPGAAAFGFLDFDAGSRIAEAYAKAGKELGYMIAKKAK